MYKDLNRDQALLQTAVTVLFTNPKLQNIFFLEFVPGCRWRKELLPLQHHHYSKFKIQESAEMLRLCCEEVSSFVEKLLRPIDLTGALARRLS